MGRYNEILTKSAAFQNLAAFIGARRDSTPGDFEGFEAELSRLVRGVEAELTGEELARYDVDGECIVIAGREFHRVLSGEPKEYLSAAGAVVVPRSLFRARGESRSVCPLELRAGIVGGVATPRLARQACFLMGQLTSRETAEVFQEFGVPGPSASTCDRLPKVVSDTWEKQREHFESCLRVQETVPVEATVVAVSLDGVMVADKDGQREAKLEREQAAEKGLQKKQCGPAGYREVGCGTVTLYAPGDDEDGKPKRLETVRYGRAPEYKKATLTEQLDAELDSILGVRPDLVLVALADGAEENWRYFDSPKWLTATKIVDFGHGAQHLKAGLTVYHGADAIEGRAEYERLKVILRDKAGGVDDVIAELKRLRRKMPARSSKARKQTLTDEITYFTNQRERMNYASYQARGLPIGSGIVEATCKTLATQRLKRSGMSWRDGKQAILTIRSLQQSDRWPRAWPLVSAAFKQPVATVKNRGGLRVITQLDRAA